MDAQKGYDQQESDVRSSAGLWSNDAVSQYSGTLLRDEADAHTSCRTQPRTNSTSTSAASGCAILSIERTPSICRQIYDAMRYQNSCRAITA